MIRDSRGTRGGWLMERASRIRAASMSPPPPRPCPRSARARRQSAAPPEGEGLLRRRRRAGRFCIVCSRNSAEILIAAAARRPRRPRGSPRPPGRERRRTRRWSAVRSACRLTIGLPGRHVEHPLQGRVEHLRPLIPPGGGTLRWGRSVNVRHLRLRHLVGVGRRRPRPCRAPPSYGRPRPGPGEDGSRTSTTNPSSCSRR